MSGGGPAQHLTTANQVSHEGPGDFSDIEISLKTDADGEKSQQDFPTLCDLCFCLVGGLEHFLFFHILGMSSSQLTNSIIFQRGGSTTNQLPYER